MLSLVGLDKVEGVKNEVHRGVLVALRDTDLSVKEIADSLGIASYSVYDIAHQYLPHGFMMARRKQLKRSSPDDLVHVVPPQSNNRPTVGGARAPENVSQDKSSSQSASKRVATGRDKDSVSSQAEPNRLYSEQKKNSLLGYCHSYFSHTFHAYLSRLHDAASTGHSFESSRQTAALCRLSGCPSLP